jgi:hypothetical protein
MDYQSTSSYSATQVCEINLKTNSCAGKRLPNWIIFAGTCVVNCFRVHFCCRILSRSPIRRNHVKVSRAIVFVVELLWSKFVLPWEQWNGKVSVANDFRPLTFVSLLNLLKSGSSISPEQDDRPTQTILKRVEEVTSCQTLIRNCRLRHWILHIKFDRTPLIERLEYFT